MKQKQDSNKEANRVFLAFVDTDKQTVVIARRAEGTNNAGQYGLIGGKIDSGESPSNAAVRELFEETGLSLTVDQLEASLYDSHTAATNKKTYLFLEIKLNDLFVFNKSQELDTFMTVSLSAIPMLEKPLHKSLMLWYLARKEA